MEARMLHFVVVVFAFLCVLAGYGSEGNRRLVDTPTSNGISWNIQEIDEETVKQALIHCTEELKDSAEAVESLESYLHNAATLNILYNGNSDITLLAKRIIQKALVDLPLQEKQILLDCLRDKSHPPSDSGKEIESKTWLSRCQELFHEWSYVPRRYLRRRDARLRRRQRNRAPAPGPVEVKGIQPPSRGVRSRSRSRSRSQSRSRSRSRSRFRSRSRSPVPQPISPIPSPAKTPVSAPPENLISPPPSVVNSPLSVVKSPPSVVNSPPPKKQNGASNPEENNKNKMYIIAAAASTAVAGIGLIALFLFCFIKSKKNKVGPKDGQRDEKPLLNISSSNLSAGSSQKAQTTGISSKKDFKTSSAVNNLSAVGDNKDQAVIQPPGASGDTNTTLPAPLPPAAPPPPPPPAAPPPPPPKPPAPRAPPPPPPRGARPPPNPPKSGNMVKPSPLGPHHRGSSSIDEGSEKSSDSDPPKAKLKPLFWDKVANPDHAMVWHEIKAGSFQFNEELMETLFGYAQGGQGKNARKASSSESVPQYIQIIDPKKSQNLAILLRALNVTTEEVCDALNEGNELPPELIQTLLKMAPTTEEELKLRLFSGDLSQLGPAERFLKVIVDIPFAFKRLESLLFMSTFQEEVSSVKESFASLEVACEELKNSRLFLKLLEAVLKTGNRMNDGTYRGGAQAFKLDTLLKLSDVKGTDGKTTLLHFVVQEIIRSEGVRAARRLRESQSMSSVKTEDLVEDFSQETADYHRGLGLQVVSGLSSELENVKKAALIDMDNLSATMSNINQSYGKNRDFLKKEMQSLEKGCEFRDTLASFVEQGEAEVKSLLEEEKRIMALAKSTGDYFHGNAGKDEGLRLFVIVRDFLLMLDKVCKEVKASIKLPVKPPRKETLTTSPSQESRQESLLEVHKRLFPSIKHRPTDDFSSDDES